nr:MAG TPA: hypothetical protein [Caudoviricetes sp.]
MCSRRVCKSRINLSRDDYRSIQARLGLSYFREYL